MTSLDMIKSLVDKNDVFGNLYIELISKAINDNRGVDTSYTMASKRVYKEQLFSKQGRDYNYCEVHHIIPRCCGGTDDSDNLVILFQTSENKEHLLAHEYLWKSTSLFLENKNKLASSYLFISKLVGNKLKQKEFNDCFEQSLKVSTKSGKDNGMYGKHHSLETREKMKWSEDKRKKHSGGNNPMYGKHWSNEKIDQIRKNQPTRVKIYYNGVLYDSVSMLSKIPIDGKLRSKNTIMDWARKQINGLKLFDDSNLIEYTPKNKEIIYKGKTYKSSRNLIKQVGGIFKNHSSVAKWAREESHGLKYKK